MLVSLRIQNLALVEDLSLELQAGFTALTGETGAGKSLLVDALSLLIGARGDSELVRTGSDRALVDGVIQGDFPTWQAFLETKGLPAEQPVVIRREVSAQGRSRSWINGASCNLGDLREAGRLWMRLTSQHDHQSLLSEDRHLILLDEALCIQADLSSEVESVREAENALKARKKSESEREERLAWLAEQIQDLEKLSPKANEWTQLKGEREPLRHAAQLEQAFRESTESFMDALPAIERAHRAIIKAAGVLPEIQSQADRMRSCLLELEDLQALSRDQANHWSKTGVDRIEQVETRLAQFERLARRFHCEPDELNGTLKAFKEEEQDLKGGNASLQELEKRLSRSALAYAEKAAVLHEKRSKAIPALEKEVHKRLFRLGMTNARLQARLSIAQDGQSPVEHLGQSVKVAPSGFSELALWIETNSGEGFKPLARIASGGELSRVMMAFLGAGVALGGHQDKGLTLVLDEVDAGIGGETALAVGASVQELGGSHQVLAVTHLAQVAARADHHGFLSKATHVGRTRTHLSWLDGNDRIRELARLLSGHPDGQEAQNHARTLMVATHCPTNN